MGVTGGIAAVGVFSVQRSLWELGARGGQRNHCRWSLGADGLKAELEMGREYIYGWLTVILRRDINPRREIM